MSDIDSPETENLKKSDVILGSFLKTILTSTKADVVEFFRYDLEGKNRLILEACEPSCTRSEKTERIKIGDEFESSVCGLVALSGRPLTVSDTRLYPHIYLPSSADKFKYLSELSVPVRSVDDNSVLGVINLESERPNGFSPGQEKEIEIMANQLVVALNAAEAMTELEVLRNIDSAILKGEDPYGVYRVIVESARELTGADHGQLLRLSDDKKRLYLLYSTGNPSLKDFDVDDCVSGKAIKEDRPIRTPDWKKEPELKKIFKRSLKDTCSQLVVPLNVDGESIGALNVESKIDYAFTRHHEEVLKDISKQAAIALRFTIRMEQNSKDVKMLSEIDVDLLKAGSVLKIYNTVFEAAKRIGETEFCQILATEDKYRNKLFVKESSFGERTSFDVSDCASGELIEDDKKPYVYFDDVDADKVKRFSQQMPITTRSALMIPIKTGTITTGIINLESEKPKHFSERHINLLINLANKTGCALETVRGMRKVIHDIKGVIVNAETAYRDLKESRESFSENLILDFDTFIKSLDMLHGWVGDILPSEPRPEPIILKEFIENLRSSISPSVLPGFELRCPHPIAPVCFDPNRLNRVFVHLFGNATKALKKVETPRLIVSIENPDGRTLRVGVEDNGQGMTEEQKRVCFAPGRSPDSTGLGLFTCQEALMEAGGNIELEWSERKKGTRFSLFIPKCEGFMISYRNFAGGTIDNRSILVLSDDIQWVKLISKTLGDHKITKARRLEDDRFTDIENKIGHPGIVLVDFANLSIDRINQITKKMLEGYSKVPGCIKVGYSKRPNRPEIVRDLLHNLLE